MNLKRLQSDAFYSNDHHCAYVRLVCQQILSYSHFYFNNGYNLKEYSQFNMTFRKCYKKALTVTLYFNVK